MPGSIAIRAIPVASRPAISTILQRLRAKYEERLGTLFREELDEEHARKIIHATVNFIARNYFKREPTQQERSLRVYIAKGHSRAAQKAAEGHSPQEVRKISDERIMDPQKGEYNRETQTVIINPQKIRMDHKEDWPNHIDICFKITLAHETLHHLGDFGDEYKGHKLNWLNDGFAELLAREILKIEFGIINQAEIRCKGYHQRLEAVRLLAELVGFNVLFEAWQHRSFQKVSNKLDELGLNEKQINALLAGAKYADKNNANYRQFVRTIKGYIKKKHKRLQGEDEEEQPSIGEYAGIFGKAGEEALPNIERLRGIPQEERDRMLQGVWAILQAKKLRMDGRPIQPIRTFDDVKKDLSAQYNGSTKFLVDWTVYAVHSHLTIQNGERPSPVETIDYIREVAAAFEERYKVKPTMRQLFQGIGEEAYSYHSHELGITDFFGIGPATRRIIQEQADLLTSSPSTGMDFEKPEGIREFCNMFGIRFEESEIQKTKELISFATFIPGACNKREFGDREVAEIILSAKARLGNVAGIQEAGPMLDVLTERLKAYGFDIEKLRHITEIPDFTARAYFFEHYQREPAPQDLEALKSLLRSFNILYPAVILTFDPVRGFVSYQHQKVEHQVFIGPKPPGGGNGGSMGKFEPYGGNRFAPLLEQHTLPPDINPFRMGPKAKEELQELAKQHYPTDLARYGALFERYATGGQLGFKLDMESERPNGCFDVEETLEHRYCLCLEHAFLYRALGAEIPGIDTEPLIFKVFRDENGSLIPHISNGILVENDAETMAVLEKLVAAQKKPRIAYYLFDADREFSQNILRRVGRGNKILILVDLSQGNFGAQYQEIRLMTSDEEMLSAYFVDRGSYYMRKGDRQRALENFETALRINPYDELARSHLIAYFSDIRHVPERVLELTQHFNLLVNTEDLVSRALVLISLGRFEDAIVSLMHALQLSEHANKASILLRDVMGR